MERLPAALPVAGHAGAAGRLALPPVVLADVTRLDSRAEAGTRTRHSSLALWSPAAAAGAQHVLTEPQLRLGCGRLSSSEDEADQTERHRDIGAAGKMCVEVVEIILNFLRTA